MKLDTRSLILFCWIIFFCLILNQQILNAATKQIKLILPKTRLHAAELAVIANLADPVSIKIAKYYQQVRNIPEQNMIYVTLPTAGQYLTPNSFSKIKKLVEQKTPANVQAYLLAWREPYQVGCMSITSAFAFGYNTEYCAVGCKPTRISPYFNSLSLSPYDQYSIRPSMLLGAKTFAQAKKIIDRGVAADNTQPKGVIYLVNTRDRARNIRAMFYPMVEKHFAQVLQTKHIKANSIKNKNDVLFYFTGLSKVTDLDKNQYLPGAIADHLTSAGGQLNGSKQMPADQWLQAGATASYGTVEEPCNYPQKFPHPYLAIYFYFKGASLIEAYWKSVAMPGQGLFIGEPLAHPFSGSSLYQQDRQKSLASNILYKGMYLLIQQLNSNKFKIIKSYVIKKNIDTSHISIPPLKAGTYRLIRVSPNSYSMHVALKRIIIHTGLRSSGHQLIPLSLMAF